MLALINDILDYSRLAGGELKMREVAFELSETLEALLGDFTEQAREKGLAINICNETFRPLLLAGDPARLGQVLVNLVGNAIKFTERGEVSVSVTCEVETALEAKLRFTIADTGIGIPPHVEKNRLFAPFSQADSSSTRTHGGSGFGFRHADADRGADARGNQHQEHTRQRLDLLVHGADAQGSHLDAERAPQLANRFAAARS